MPWRWSRAASRRAPRERRLRRLVAAGRRQQRVHARRVARQLHVLRERARVLARDRRDDVARPVGRQLRAQDDRAAREIAAEPGRPPHDVVRVELVRLGAQLLEERAAEVLLDLLLRLLHRDLRQRRDRRQVEELGRLGVELRGRVAEQQDAAEHVVARRDRDLGEDARRHLDGPVLRPVADVPAQRREIPRAAGRDRRGAEPRHDDRHGRARRVGGELGDAAETVAAQHGVHHLQVDGPQPLDERAVACGLCWLGGGHRASTRPARPLRPRGGPGASPRPTRPCGSGTPRRRAARTPCRRRSTRCGRA